MKIKNAMLFDGNGFYPGELAISPLTGRICEAKALPQGDAVLDAGGLYAIPGLVDIHFHGCMGHDFCEGSEAAIRTMAAYEASQGVLAICPATMTFDEDTLDRVMDAAALHQNDRDASLVGINMEGPFLSPQKIGAQNPAFLHAPDAAMFLRLQQRAHGLIRLCDVAPELPGALDFIRALKGQTVLSLAHTAADYETALAAFRAGASHITHLYNAMPGMAHRAPGPIPAAAECGADAEIICDGVHIDGAMVRLAFRLFGAEHMILISDSMMATGLPDGSYTLGGQGVTVAGRRCTLTRDAGTIAGSNTNLYQCLCRAVQEMHVPLCDAVRAATLNPARSIHIEKDYGSLSRGCYGNVLLLDADMRLHHILRHGALLPRA